MRLGSRPASALSSDTSQYSVLGRARHSTLSEEKRESYILRNRCVSKVKGWLTIRDNARQSKLLIARPLLNHNDRLGSRMQDMRDPPVGFTWLQLSRGPQASSVRTNRSKTSEPTSTHITRCGTASRSHHPSGQMSARAVVHALGTLHHHHHQHN